MGYVAFFMKNGVPAVNAYNQQNTGFIVKPLGVGQICIVSARSLTASIVVPGNLILHQPDSAGHDVAFMTGPLSTGTNHHFGPAASFVVGTSSDTQSKYYYLDFSTFSDGVYEFSIDIQTS